MLDAFYVGRAAAQTISERLGAVLGDVLSEVVKFNAEQQRAIRCGVMGFLAAFGVCYEQQPVIALSSSYACALLTLCRDFAETFRRKFRPGQKQTRLACCLLRRRQLPCGQLTHDLRTHGM